VTHGPSLAARLPAIEDAQIADAQAPQRESRDQAAHAAADQHDVDHLAPRVAALWHPVGGRVVQIAEVPTQLRVQRSKAVGSRLPHGVAATP
jgi:hypothetical protein